MSFQPDFKVLPEDNICNLVKIDVYIVSQPYIFVCSVKYPYLKILLQKNVGSGYSCNLL